MHITPGSLLLADSSHLPGKHFTQRFRRNGEDSDIRQVRRIPLRTDASYPNRKFGICTKFGKADGRARLTIGLHTWSFLAPGLGLNWLNAAIVGVYFRAVAYMRAF